MLAFLLFILYTIIAVSVFNRVTRNYRNYLSKKQLTVSFILKLAFGVLYGLVFLHFYNGDDTWLYHWKALEITKKLEQDPAAFFRLFYSSGGPDAETVFSAEPTSFWNNLITECYMRLLVLFNFLSFGNYYVTVVLFCSLVFTGHLLLYRLFTHRFPEASRLLFIAIFLLPVALFWLSGVRKDGVLFLGVSLSLYYFDRLLAEKITIKNLLLFIAGLSIIFLLRNFMLLCLLPAFAAWWLCSRFRLNAPVAFIALYLLAIACFFLTSWLKGVPDLPEKVAQRQYRFMMLQGNTRLELDSLHATPASYLHVLPQAIDHSFLRPYITEGRSFLHLASALDNLLFFGIALLVILFPRKGINAALKDPLLLACLFSSLAGYIFIGYIVPFPGAIVRYKVIFELLFFCSFAILLRPLVPVPSFRSWQKEGKKSLSS
ncbi:MAG TPA: hypothetical protein VJ647_01540 [Chitinophagaceae bacterium]|nr:hypothetical protein [Chitinophagaceae bacterium]